MKDGVCSACLDGCFECSIRKEDCKTCKEGYEFDKEGFCRKKCAQGSSWNGKRNNTCTECSVKVAGCQECEDISQKCTKCGENMRLMKMGTVCAPYCESGFFIGSQNHGNDVENTGCKKCSQVESSGVGCSRCQDFSGLCSECSIGYNLTQENFCRKECLDGRIWSGMKENRCLRCPTNCKVCSQLENECSECKTGYIVSQDRRECWPYFPEKNISVELKPRFIFEYFDRLKGGVVLVFDRKVTKKNIPTKLEELQVDLLVGNKSKELIVLRESFEEDKNRKVIEVKIEEKQLIQASLKITSKIRSKRRMNQESVSAQSQETGLYTKMITGVSYYKPSDIEIYQTLGSILSIFMMCMTFLTLFTSLPTALSLMLTTQTLSMLRFIDIDYPANVLAFLKPFSYNAFTIIPNLIPVTKVAKCNMPEVYFKNEVPCVGLKTIGGLAILIFVYLVCYAAICYLF